MAQGARRPASSAPTPGVAARPSERWRGGARESLNDRLAVEAPVQIVVNGAPFAVMMATPLDLEDFALGFALTEGVIAAPWELERVGVAERLEGYELAIEIAPARAAALGSRSRAIEGRSGCGICGSRAIEELVRPPESVASDLRFSAVALSRALDGMRAGQSIADATGATHAAAWARADGEVLAVREDVGRHNALDKLIGHLVRTGFDADGGFALVTSRASYELVIKAAVARMPALCAVSAPTALAVDLAHTCGLTLVGFARGRDCAVYTHPKRFRGAAS